MDENIALERGKRAGNMFLVRMLVNLTLGLFSFLLENSFSDFDQTALIGLIIGGAIVLAIVLAIYFVLIKPLKTDNLDKIRAIYVLLGCLSLIVLFFALKSDSSVEIINGVLSAFISALLIVALFKPGHIGKICCYFAASVSVISLLTSIGSEGFAFRDYLDFILYAVYIVYLGLYIESKGPSAKKQIIEEDASISQSEERTAKPKSDYDDLIKLKDLMDKGVITPEEYEIKKKQILGL